jgi:protein-S-isoprenylcysteine O-methyltransferase Ste14
MTTTQFSQSYPAKPHLDRSGIKRIITLIVATLFIAMILFISAGRINWVRAWIWIGLWSTMLTLNGIVLFKKNPELINARGKKHEDTKGFDKLIFALSTPLFILLFAVAGLDAGRFGWSSMSLGWLIVGILMFILGGVFAAWAMFENAHFELTVRIQEERHHQVCSSGPYRYVRHPGYLGAIVTYIGYPLILGSWWALLPAVAIALVLVLRTVLEDRTLQKELPGYKEYAVSTRYRLVPLVW